MDCLTCIPAGHEKTNFIDTKDFGEAAATYHEVFTRLSNTITLLSLSELTFFNSKKTHQACVFVSN